MCVCERVIIIIADQDWNRQQEGTHQNGNMNEWAGLRPDEPGLGWF